MEHQLWPAAESDLGESDDLHHGRQLQWRPSCLLLWFHHQCLPSTPYQAGGTHPHVPGTQEKVVVDNFFIFLPGPKTIKKNTNSTQNKSQTHRAKQYEVTSFLSTDCELSTETCSKNVYSLGPWPGLQSEYMRPAKTLPCTSLGRRTSLSV